MLPDPAVEEECNEDGDAYARAPLPLPGARALTLPQARVPVLGEVAPGRRAFAVSTAGPAAMSAGPRLPANLTSPALVFHLLNPPQGVLGEVVPLPDGLTSTDSLWALPPGEDIEHVQLVRWRLSLPDGAGQWILLCRLAEALALVASGGGLGSVGGASSARVAAAQAELAAGLGLLAAFCSRDPQTALELLHVELPTASGALEGGQRGPDLLSLACQAAAVLAGLPEPPAAAIADCLAICGALAEGIPGRVAHELLSLAGASPALVAATPPGQAAELPLLGRVLAAEAAQGRYPATQAFIRLLTTLVSGGCGWAGWMWVVWPAKWEPCSMPVWLVNPRLPPTLAPQLRRPRPRCTC